ncbi:uncharacterized protein [Amphiura filiformis]|uniref:uncharacterized protein n=1 Tax=Amphiura filiformis TaxID=82378 RepID=UPI003B2216CD
MRPTNTLKSLLVHPKDKKDIEQTSDVVYNIPCKGCDKSYVGETGRQFGTRLKEHKKDSETIAERKFTRANRKESTSEQHKSAITDHIAQENHVIEWEGAKFVAKSYKDKPRNGTDSTTTNSGNVQRLRLRNVNLWLLNIRGLRSNIGQLQARIQLAPPSSKPDLILITESKLDSSVPDDSSHININGYSHMRRDRSDDSGWGGCLIYYKNGFPIVRETNLEPKLYELMVFSIQSESGTVLLSLVYCPQNKIKGSLAWYDKNLDRLLSKTKANICILAGDFNCHHQEWLGSRSPTDEEGRIALNLCNSHGLTQIVNGPTHQLGNRLDLIMTDAPNLFTPNETECNVGTSDHFLVKTALEVSPPSEPSPLRHVWMYKKADWDNLRNDLAAVRWNELLTKEDPETACSNITSAIQTAMHSNIPQKTVRSFVNHPEWWNEECDKALKKKTGKVKKELLKLDINKASGPDDVPALVLKMAAPELATPLARLFQLCFDKGYMPAQWKCAHVIPCYKKGDKHTPGNYRPISLLCIMSKVMEKLVSKKMWKHLDEHHLISPRQFGFRAGHSTSDALTYVSQCLANSLNNREEARVVCLDISRAFDRVWHTGLLEKLSALGFSGTLHAWLTDYLKDRSLKVVLNGRESGSKKINAGVPQGSILGPLLFIIFIDDISQDLNNQSILYADDATIMSFIKSREDRLPAAASLNRDLAKIETWAKTWNVLFGAAKCKTTTISNRRDADANHPPLHFFGVTLEEAESVDLLGLTLNNNLSWNQVVTKMSKTAGQRLGLLRRASPYILPAQRAIIYKAMIRSKMEYASKLAIGTSNFKKIPAGFDVECRENGLIDPTVRIAPGTLSRLRELERKEREECEDECDWPELLYIVKGSALLDRYVEPVSECKNSYVKVLTSVCNLG